MKSFKYAILLFLIILTTDSYGDIIITKPETRNIYKITNLDEFPEITLFAVYKDENLPQFAHLGFSRVNEDGVIRLHVFHSLELIAVKKEYLKNRENKDIDWNDKTNVRKSNITIQPDYDKPELKDIREVEHSLKIVGFSDTTMVLHKTKQVSKYRNKKPDLIQYFDFEGDTSKMSQGFN